MSALHYIMNYAYYQQHGQKFASVEIPLEVDSLPEIEEGLQEIEDALTPQAKAYWNRARASILRNSSDQDIDNAVKEWIYDGQVWYQPGGTCELCGKHPISYHFPIKNKVTGNRISVGSECIQNYLHIPGYGSPEEIKKKLLAARSRLVKQRKGLSDTLDAFYEAEELSIKLIDLYSRLSVGGKDFDFKEYERTLADLSYRFSSIDEESSRAVQTLRYTTLARLITLAESLGKRTRKVVVTGPVTMVKAAMNVRNDEEKVTLLKRIQELMTDLLKAGEPSEFVSRMTDNLADALKGLLLKVSDRMIELETQINRATEGTLAKLRPYNELYGTYEKAIELSRKNLHEKAEQYRLEIAMAVDPDPAIRQKANIGIISWNLKGITLLAQVSWAFGGPHDIPLFKMAYNLDAIMKASENYHFFESLERALCIRYRLQQITDKAGVKALYFRYLNKYSENVLVRGDAYTTLSHCAMLFRGDIRIPGVDFETVSGWAEEEVDDIKALMKKKLHQVLSERWGINVEKTFKLFSADNKVDMRLCEGLVLEWEKWPRLGPAFTAKFKLKANEQSEPVPNNMWDYLKTTLTQTVD